MSRPSNHLRNHIVHCSLSNVHCPLSIFHFPLSTFHWPSSTFHYPLTMVLFPLFICLCVKHCLRNALTIILIMKAILLLLWGSWLYSVGFLSKVKLNFVILDVTENFFHSKWLHFTLSKALCTQRSSRMGPYTFSDSISLSQLKNTNNQYFLSDTFFDKCMLDLKENIITLIQGRRTLPYFN